MLNEWTFNTVHIKCQPAENEALHYIAEAISPKDKEEKLLKQQ